MGDRQLQTKTPAEFFAENRNIAGFDNDGKSLYTTVRELVENALDAAETMGQLPAVDVTIEEISAARFATLVGMAPGERTDAALYEDTAAEAERLRKEAAAEKRRLAAAQRKRAAAEAAGGAPFAEAEAAAATGRAGAAAAAAAEAAAAGRAAAGPVYYRVTVTDNGKGMAFADIPNMLGVVLSGTKYGVQQSRGKFGLGAKMALIWAKQTTGVPVDVRSAQPGSATVSSYTLDINLARNAPDVQRSERLPNAAGWHGTSVALTIRGAWGAYRSKILRYLHQLAVITPYAELTFRYSSEAGKRGDVALCFRRRTDAMPRAPAETAYHPAAVDLELIRTLARRTRAKTVKAFLTSEFICIDGALAARLISEMGHGVEAGGDPRGLQAAQTMAMHRLFGAAKFDPPPADCLSPAGEYNLRLGVMKELRPELVATYCGTPGACGGHPFMVEVAVSLGGRDVKPGLNVFRFANRIPLLFEPGSDVITKTAADVEWGRYKIDKATAKLGVFVSIVSTRIPFRGAGKEHIAEEAAIADEVRKALMTCANQLAKKLGKRAEAKKRKARRKALQRYIPDASRAIFGVLAKMAARDEPAEKRRRLAAEAASAAGAPPPAAGEAEADLVGAVARGELTEATLRSKLEAHIEQHDQEQALEFAMSAGRTEGAARPVFLAPTSARHEFGPSTTLPTGASFRLLL